MRDPHRRAMTPAWWVLFVLGIMVAAGAVIWLGAQDDSDGAPLIENPGGVIIALVGGASAVLAVVLPQVLEIKNQVANNHKKPDGSPLNLRDDLDGKHDIIVRAVEGLASDIRGIRRDNGRMANRLDYTIQRLDKAIDRIDDIEDTQAPEKET